MRRCTLQAGHMTVERKERLPPTLPKLRSTSTFNTLPFPSPYHHYSHNTHPTAPSLTLRMATPFLIGLGVLGGALGGRYAFRTMAARAASGADKWAKGGFQQKMDMKEAKLILGIKSVVHSFLGLTGRRRRSRKTGEGLVGSCRAGREGRERKGGKADADQWSRACSFAQGPGDGEEDQGGS
jgi:hypothetical protein